MSLVFLGDIIEQAIAQTGADRERIRVYIYECKCRNRKKHFYEVAEWANAVIAGWAGLSQLAELLAKGQEK